MYIVQGKQAVPEYLVAYEEMPNIGAAEAHTCRAIACLVERPGIVSILGAFDVEASIARESGAVPAHARRRDAVEQVNTALDAFDHIFWKPDAHQVARPIARKRLA